MDSKDSNFSFQSKSGVSNVNFDPSSDPLDPTAKNTLSNSNSNPHSNSTLDPSANPNPNSKSDQSPNFNISSFDNNNNNTLNAKLSKTGFFNGNSNFAKSINKPSNFNANRRTSVSAEALNPDTFGNDNWKPPVHQLSNIQLQRLNASVIKNFLFSQLDEESLKTIIFALEEKRVPKNTEIIKQGDEGDFFYVVEKGTVDYFVNNENVNTSSDGSSFGELALMYNSPRAATVISKTDCILWALDRMTFRRILLEGTAKKRSLYENFLKEVPVLQSLSSYERSKLADALNTESYTVGQNIVTEGEAGENFYFIEDGTAEVLKSDDNDHDKAHVITTLKKGDYFGELALLYDSPRQATVRATSPLKVVTLNKSGFQRLLGPAVDILKIQDPTKSE